MRDASRIRIKAPNIDVDSDGSYADDANAAYLCVTGNVSWSGFTRQAIKTTCSEATLDDWGNIVHTYQNGRFIEMGTLTLDVDWNPSTTDKINAAFRQLANGNYRFEFPAEVGETSGPVIVIPACITSMVPITNILTEGDEARSRATLTLKLAGEWTITNAA